MERIVSLAAFSVMVSFLAFAGTGHAQVAVKLGSSIRMSPIFYLPIMAAEEKGFWKEEGLRVEWVPFRGSADMYRAVGAGAVGVGLTDAPSMILASSRGLPVVAVADLQSAELFVLWIRVGAGIRGVEDLRGKRIGVTRLGGITHAYAEVLAKRHGIEKEVKIVGMGGVPETVAGAKAGAIDALIEPTHLVLAIKREGLIRSLVNMAEVVPKPWVGHWVFAESEMAKKDVRTVKGLVSGLIKATNFLRTEPDWAINKMVEVSGFKPEEAREIYLTYEFPLKGTIPPKAIENLISFLVAYGQVPREKAPRVERVYTEEFLPSS